MNGVVQSWLIKWCYMTYCLEHIVRHPSQCGG